MATTGKRPEEIIEDEVQDILGLERTLQATEAELMANETFLRFIELQKQVREQSAKVWGKVEGQMIEYNIKSIKGDWGSLTIAERINWKTDENLPAKFYKKVVDTKKLSDTFKLEGKPIKGAEHYFTKYLTKRFK